MTARDKRFGKRLKELRNAAGLTQEALSKKSSHNRNSIAAWETGSASPPPKQKCVDLAQALGADHEALWRLAAWGRLNTDELEALKAEMSELKRIVAKKGVFTTQTPASDYLLIESLRLWDPYETPKLARNLKQVLDRLMEGQKELGIDFFALSEQLLATTVGLKELPSATVTLLVQSFCMQISAVKNIEQLFPEGLRRLAIEKERLAKEQQLFKEFALENPGIFAAPTDAPEES